MSGKRARERRRMKGIRAVVAIMDETSRLPAPSRNPRSSLRVRVVTYWNFQPAVCAYGTAVVLDDPEIPAYWARAERLIGLRIPVVRVSYYGETFWLSDHDGSGWRKVTIGRGGPRYPHANVSVDPATFRLASEPTVL